MGPKGSFSVKELKARKLNYGELGTKPKVNGKLFGNGNVFLKMWLSDKESNKPVMALVPNWVLLGP